MFDNYEKLNEYFKDIYTYLQKKNPYLLNNICKITTLSGTVLNLLRDFNFDVNMRENNLSIQDVESMARAIIEKLNKDYLESFDKLVESKELRLAIMKSSLEVMFIHTSKMTVKLLKWFLLRENIIIVM